MFRPKARFAITCSPLLTHCILNLYPLAKFTCTCIPTSHSCPTKQLTSRGGAAVHRPFWLHARCAVHPVLALAPLPDVCYVQPHARLQPRKTSDTTLAATHPPSRIAGVSLAPLPDAEVCEVNPRQPQLHQLGESLQAPPSQLHHPVRGALPYKKPGQLKVAVPMKSTSLNFRGAAQPQADQLQQRGELRAEGRALHKQRTQGPEPLVTMYRELNEADSLW